MIDCQIYPGRVAEVSIGDIYCHVAHSDAVCLITEIKCKRHRCIV